MRRKGGSRRLRGTHWCRKGTCPRTGQGWPNKGRFVKWASHTRQRWLEGMRWKGTGWHRWSTRRKPNAQWAVCGHGCHGIPRDWQWFTIGRPDYWGWEVRETMCYLIQPFFMYVNRVLHSCVNRQPICSFLGLFPESWLFPCSNCVSH